MKKEETSRDGAKGHVKLWTLLLTRDRYASHNLLFSKGECVLWLSVPVALLCLGCGRRQITSF